MELLAPAGDIEAGYAALYYGADAVYLGLQQFSARATATNFTAEDLNEFTAYAHSLGKKVFVTINTILQESELPALLTQLDICSQCHVDAIISQDLGVARIIQKSYPELILHASTQMAVHNKEGALALKNLGFKRVVLARELPLATIKEIAAIPDLETEVFIHGALCYSYSGLCLFSSFEQGRSANRGKCAYPCRACFHGSQGDKHYFSMKDLALQGDILKLPVTSLKIEGRKKSALYVAAVVNYYRHILNGEKANITYEEDIKQIFSRPWTHFHFNGKNQDVIDQNFVGHRGLPIGHIDNIYKGKISFRTSHDFMKFDGIQIDLPGQEKPFGFSAQDIRIKGKNVFKAQAGQTVDLTLPPNFPFIPLKAPVYLASSSAVKGAYDYTKPKPHAYKNRHNISINVVITPDTITANAMNQRALITGIFTPAKNPLQVENAIRQAFTKTQDTDWIVSDITINNPNELFVPISLLNQLRRSLLEKLTPSVKHGLLPPLGSIIAHTPPKWIIKTDCIDNLSTLDLDQFEEITICVTPNLKPEDLHPLPKKKVRLALPTIARNVLAYRLTVKKLLDAGYKKWEIGNYWGLQVLPTTGIDLTFDAPLYMMNTQSISMAKEIGAKRVTLSVEGTEQNSLQIALKSPLPTTLVVYQDIPLFISSNCPFPTDCTQCAGQSRHEILIKGKQKYHVTTKACETTVYADTPFALSGHYTKIPANFYRMDFVGRQYTAEQVTDLSKQIIQNKILFHTSLFNWNKEI
ncbi:MAG: U32 family peptidase [Alphaproteobacteria bacterium]|nr:U32 family peptidase [Alphaproteobacteria bacterium]